LPAAGFNWVENTSPVDADGDYASNRPFDVRWSFPLQTRSPIEIGSLLGFIYLAYLNFYTRPT
jgi:hypothetical protein